MTTTLNFFGFVSKWSNSCLICLYGDGAGTRVTNPRCYQEAVVRPQLLRPEPLCEQPEAQEDA